jgi:hypothetical protein
MSLGVTYGLSMRTMYNGVSLQVGFGLVQALESIAAGRSDEEVVLDYFLASTRDVALGFGTAYAVRALWPALVRVASQPLSSLARTYSKSSAALQSWRNGTVLSARELVGSRILGRFDKTGNPFSYYMHMANTVDVGTANNAAVFYSGPGSRRVAEAFAQANGRTTLEMTAGGSWLDSQRLFDEGSLLTQKQAIEVWSTISRRYASEASGTVVGFVANANPNEYSIWLNTLR